MLSSDNTLSSGRYNAPSVVKIKLSLPTWYISFILPFISVSFNFNTTSVNVSSSSCNLTVLSSKTNWYSILPFLTLYSVDSSILVYTGVFFTV